jgi:hypothetical protein
MATTLSRHQGNYARPQKTLPITMPTKTSTTFNSPMSKVALPPPELSETSTIHSGGSDNVFSEISDDYGSSRYRNAIDPMDEVTSRMDKIWDPTKKMDKSIARQAQT